MSRSPEEEVIRRSIAWYFAAGLAQVFDESGAVNHVTCRFGPDSKGRLFDVTVAFVEGKSVAEVIRDYREAIKAIAAAHQSINDIEELPVAIANALALIPVSEGGTLEPPK